MAETSQSWVRVTEASNQPQSLIIVSLLRGAGIPCRSVQESVGTLYGLSASSPLGTIDIEVPESLLKTAEQILKAKYDEEEIPKPEE